MIEANRITRRSLYTLALILAIAAYMRVYTLFFLHDFFSWDIPIFIGIALISIGLVWWLAYTYLNFVAAVVAGLMYAVNPWSINSAFLPVDAIIVPLMLLAQLVVLRGSTESRKWSTRIRWAPFLFAVGLFSFGLLTGRTITPNEISPLTYLVQLISGSGLRAVAGKNISAVSIAAPSTIWLLFLGSGVVVGFAAMWVRSKLLLLLSLWIALPLAIAFPWRTISIYFITPLLPLLCLLVGAGVAWLIKLLPGKPYSRMIVLAVYGAIFLSQGLWWLGVVRYLQSNP